MKSRVTREALVFSVFHYVRILCVKTCKLKKKMLRFMCFFECVFDVLDFFCLFHIFTIVGIVSFTILCLNHFVSVFNQF